MPAPLLGAGTTLLNNGEMKNKNLYFQRGYREGLAKALSVLKESLDPSKTHTLADMINDSEAKEIIEDDCIWDERAQKKDKMFLLKYLKGDKDFTSLGIDLKELVEYIYGDDAWMCCYLDSPNEGISWLKLPSEWYFDLDELWEVAKQRAIEEE